MKYFLIAGEASGDLHASHLIAALREHDPEAEFHFYGGDLMEKAATAGASGAASPLLRHYKTLAYMGFVQVALHARTILRGLAECKRAISEWGPDAVILVDYPGFNLKIARWAKHELPATPIYYYISPKIWAWKEHRIHAIRDNVDRLFSILPFEVDFFEGKHHYPISYVGNPTYDEVSAYQRRHCADREAGASLLDTDAERRSHASIALLPGSREAEIRDNLSVMLRAVSHQFTVEGKTEQFRIFLAVAPNIPRELYASIIEAHNRTAIRPLDVRCHDNAFQLLLSASVALVTSGTATLETALFGVPQVVCYNIRGGRVVNWAKERFLKCRFISLVNLIADREVVPELIAADMRPDVVRRHLSALLSGPAREAQLRGYDLVRQRLATPGAPQRAAEEIVALLKARQ